MEKQLKIWQREWIKEEKKKKENHSQMIEMEKFIHLKKERKTKRKEKIKSEKINANLWYSIYASQCHRSVHTGHIQNLNINNRCFISK